jgi:two-component system CheB/CheR fusion protein
VTSFFRNPEAFEVLKRKVFSKLIGQKRDGALRVWVLGCSTGQEAYSIAMSLVECCEETSRTPILQIFATDLNEALLEKARSGLYAKTLTADISPERLRRFFVQEDGGYRVNKSLRDMCVFARQNLLSDPPFSRMDLITCRNVLIYIEPGFQKKIIPTFHYALKPTGFLFLGASESIGGYDDLFEPVDKKHKIFCKKSGAVARLQMRFPPTHPAAPKAPSPPMLRGLGAEAGDETDAQRQAERIVLGRYAPPRVLINSELQVLHFYGDTSRYLKAATGRASFDVLKMASENLMLPLRTAINKARKENQRVRREDVHFDERGHTQHVTIDVVPLKNLKEQCFLILFEEVIPQSPAATVEPAIGTKDKRSRDGREKTSTTLATVLRRNSELERELADTRDYLHSVREQQEAANEGLQASNEEVQSANEELQSINEELETSKEELESTNEELTTVNDEMTTRNMELSRLNSDLVNLQNSTNMAVVLLGRDLTIRRFTAPAEKIFNLLAQDIGRSITSIKHNLTFQEQQSPNDALERLLSEVIDTITPQEREVRDKDGHWFALRARPYLTLDNKIDGAVLMVVDIDAMKQAEQSKAYLSALVESSEDAIVSVDRDGVITSWNKAADMLYGYSAKETIGKPLSMLTLPEDLKELTVRLDKVRQGGTSELFETERIRKGGEHISLSIKLSPIKNATGQIIGVSTLARDITESKQVEKALSQHAEVLESQVKQRTSKLAESVSFLENLSYTMAHDLRAPIRAMAAFSTALLEDVPLDTTGKDYAQRIHEAAQRMDRLINDLLEYSRLTHQEFPLSIVELRPNIEKVIENLSTDIGVKNAQIEVRDPIPTARCNETLLEQVLSNLILNALKFVAPGVTPKVVISAENCDSMIRVWIEDNGIGIDTVYQQRIFGVFQRLHTTEEFPGTGVGLAIAKRAVESMGGTLGVESNPGRGSKFWFKLPKG